MGLFAFVISAESQCEYLESSITRHFLAWRCVAMSARNVKTCRPTSSRLHKNGWTPLKTTPSIRPSCFQCEGFDDEIVDIFGSAFEAAWQSLQMSDSRLTHEPRIASTRQLLAKWILVLGKQGERDRTQLVEKALALLAQSNPEVRESNTAESSAGVPSSRQSSSLRGTNSRHFGSMSNRRKSS
jgi:hypothetical protein